MAVHGSVRVWGHQPGRGAAPDHRGRGHDRSKGEAGTGDVSNATTHMRAIRGGIRRLGSLPEDRLYLAARDSRRRTNWSGRWPAPASCRGVVYRGWDRDAGGRRDDDAARRRGCLRRVRHLQVGDPARQAEAIVEATTFYDDPDVIAKVSRGLGEAMVGINVGGYRPHRLADRGW